MQCVTVGQGSDLALTCPGGRPIVDVIFASYGTPLGKCPNSFTHNPSCDIDKTISLATVRAACVGKTYCDLVADSDFFGVEDPCFGTYKTLAVEVVCEAPPMAPPANAMIDLPFQLTSTLIYTPSVTATSSTLGTAEGLVSSLTVPLGSRLLSYRPGARPNRIRMDGPTISWSIFSQLPPTIVGGLATGNLTFVAKSNPTGTNPFKWSMSLVGPAPFPSVNTTNSPVFSAKLFPAYSVAYPVPANMPGGPYPVMLNPMPSFSISISAQVNTPTFSASFLLFLENDDAPYCQAFYGTMNNVVLTLNGTTIAMGSGFGAYYDACSGTLAMTDQFALDYPSGMPVVIDGQRANVTDFSLHTNYVDPAEMMGLVSCGAIAASPANLKSTWTGQVVASLNAVNMHSTFERVSQHLTFDFSDTVLGSKVLEVDAYNCMPWFSFKTYMPYTSPFSPQCKPGSPLDQGTAQVEGQLPMPNGASHFFGGYWGPDGPNPATASRNCSSGILTIDLNIDNYFIADIGPTFVNVVNSYLVFASNLPNGAPNSELDVYGDIQGYESVYLDFNWDLAARLPANPALPGSSHSTLYAYLNNPASVSTVVDALGGDYTYASLTTPSGFTDVLDPIGNAIVTELSAVMTNDANITSQPTPLCVSFVAAVSQVFGDRTALVGQICDSFDPITQTSGDEGALALTITPGMSMPGAIDALNTFMNPPTLILGFPGSQPMAAASEVVTYPVANPDGSFPSPTPTPAPQPKSVQMQDGPPMARQALPWNLIWPLDTLAITGVPGAGARFGGFPAGPSAPLPPLYVNLPGVTIVGAMNTPVNPIANWVNALGGGAFANRLQAIMGNTVITCVIDDTHSIYLSMGAGDSVLTMSGGITLSQISVTVQLSAHSPPQTGLLAWAQLDMTAAGLTQSFEAPLTIFSSYGPDGGVLLTADAQWEILNAAGWDWVNPFSMGQGIVIQTPLSSQVTMVYRSGTIDTTALFISSMVGLTPPPAESELTASMVSTQVFVPAASTNTQDCSANDHTWGFANEGDSVTVSCPEGTTINAINFASYGTPYGSCRSWVNGAGVDLSCHAGQSNNIVEGLCVGSQACTIDANNGVFTDPCKGVSPKHLAVSVSCTAPPPPAPATLPFTNTPYGTEVQTLSSDGSAYITVDILQSVRPGSTAAPLFSFNAFSVNPAQLVQALVPMPPSINPIASAASLLQLLLPSGTDQPFTFNPSSAPAALAPAGPGVPPAAMPPGIAIPIMGASLFNDLFSIRSASIAVDPTSGLTMVTGIDQVNFQGSSFTQDCGLPQPAGQVTGCGGIGPTLSLAVTGTAVGACSTGGSALFVNQPPLFGTFVPATLWTAAQGLFFTQTTVCVDADTSMTYEVRSPMPAAMVPFFAAAPAVSILGYTSQPSTLSAQAFFSFSTPALTSVIEPTLTGYAGRLSAFLTSRSTQATAAQAGYVASYQALRASAASIYPALAPLLPTARLLAGSAAEGEVAAFDDAVEEEFIRLLGIAEGPDGEAELRRLQTATLSGSGSGRTAAVPSPTLTATKTPKASKAPKPSVAPLVVPLSPSLTPTNRPPSQANMQAAALAAYQAVKDFVIIQAAIAHVATILTPFAAPATGVTVSYAAVFVDVVPAPEPLPTFLALDFTFMGQASSMNISVPVPMDTPIVTSLVTRNVRSQVNSNVLSNSGVRTRARAPHMRTPHACTHCFLPSPCSYHLTRACHTHTHTHVFADPNGSELPQAVPARLSSGFPLSCNVSRLLLFSHFFNSLVANAHAARRRRAASTSGLPGGNTPSPLPHTHELPHPPCGGTAPPSQGALAHFPRGHPPLSV